MYKQDLALNKLLWLICHKIKPNQISEIFLTILKMNKRETQKNGTNDKEIYTQEMT